MSSGHRQTSLDVGVGSSEVAIQASSALVTPEIRPFGTLCPDLKILGYLTDANRARFGELSPSQMEQGVVRNFANFGLVMAFMLEHQEKLALLVNSLRGQLQTANNQAKEAQERIKKVEEDLAFSEKERTSLKIDVDEAIRAKFEAEREVKAACLFRERMELELEAALTKARTETVAEARRKAVEKFKQLKEYEKLLDDWAAGSKKGLIEGLHEALMAKGFGKAAEVVLQMLVPSDETEEAASEGIEGSTNTE